MPHPRQKEIGEECCSGRENCSYYLLAMFNCNIPVCVTACSRETGELLSGSIKKNFFKWYASVRWIWLRSVKRASKEISVSSCDRFIFENN